MWRLPVVRPMVLVFAFACTGVHAEPVVIERDSQLFTEPRGDAPVAANVKRGTTGDATVRKGAWVSVKTAAGTGWLPSFNVRYGSAPSGGSVDAASLASRLTSPQKLNVTSTIGIRGLEVEDLKGAAFSEAEVKLLERYRTTDAQARAAAVSSGLRAGSIDYLDKR